MNKKVSQGVTVPSVFVTKDRKRVKQYNNDTVYLRNGDEFELELFNPTSSKVLAKIKINDHDLGSGIVLRPGERVYLERYLNEAKKFVYETYSVDGNDHNVQRAIADNGDIDVQFYQESFNQGIIYTSGTYNYPTYSPPYWSTTSPSVLYSHTTSGNSDMLIGGSGVTYGSNSCTTKSFMNNASNTGPDIEFENAINMSAEIETGRVEKGSNSDQELEYDSTSFNSYSTWRMKWKILPVSRKAVTREDLSVYCTGCGAKRKKGSHKFCPHCGNKY